MPIKETPDPHSLNSNESVIALKVRRTSTSRLNRNELLPNLLEPPGKPSSGRSQLALQPAATPVKSSKVNLRKIPCLSLPIHSVSLMRQDKCVQDHLQPSSDVGPCAMFQRKLFIKGDKDLPSRIELKIDAGGIPVSVVYHCIS
jgi:hypothetical protein